MDKFNVLISKEAIEQRVKELGEQITRDYAGKEPVIICMLKGAVYFFTDLTRNIDLPINIEFARLSSYRNGTVSGQMQVVSDITADISGKHVLIVEDIIDSGKTLAYFVEMLKTKNPASIKICALTDKKERREANIEADYVGFDVPNTFVIGYGLDYAEKYRELPYVAEVTDPSQL